MGVPHQIHTYAELRKQIHDDLRIQHPEWINSDGSSPVCDSYECASWKRSPVCSVKTIARHGSFAPFRTAAGKFKGVADVLTTSSARL